MPFKVYINGRLAGSTLFAYAAAAMANAIACRAIDPVIIKYHTSSVAKVVCKVGDTMLSDHDLAQVIGVAARGKDLARAAKYRARRAAVAAVTPT